MYELPPSSYVPHRYKDAHSASSPSPSDSQMHFYKLDKHPQSPIHKKSSPHQAGKSGLHPQPTEAVSEILYRYAPQTLEYPHSSPDHPA